MIFNMETRKTLIISLLLHGTFAALLLFSVRFQGESGKMLNEKVFFIDLKSDAEKPAPEVTKDVSLKKTVVKKIQKEPAVIVKKTNHDEVRISKDAVSDKRETDLTEHTNESSGIAQGTDTTVSNEKGDYTNSLQGGKKIIVSTKTADDKSGGLTEADALKLIGSAIERAKTYPAIARRRGFEGTVYVSFSIGPEGEPSEIEVLKSSGYNMLDEATMKVIKKAAPYPYIDDRVEVPVTYRLDD